MEKNYIDLQLGELADGAIQEKLDIEVKKIFNNIHDLNTKATNKRTITIKLDFVPDKDRQTVALESNFTTRLANIEGASTIMLTGRNLDTGIVEAKELKSNIPGQSYFDDDAELKTDVGDPVDNESNVIDLQRGSK